MEETRHFKTEITEEHKLFDLHIKEAYHYRDLIYLFVKRDFVARYKQTIIGPLWALIQPFLTTVVFTLVFGTLAGLAKTDVHGDYYIPSFLFYMSGSICWSYFSSVVSETSYTFISNYNTMGKVYYPRIVKPISTALTNLISFAIQYAMFFCIWLFYVVKGGTSIRITPAIMLFPLCVLQLAVLSTGCGIIISAVTTKYRDLMMLVGFGLQLWQYGTPIAYGLTLIPTKYIPVYMLNPVTPILTTFRYAMFGFGFFNFEYYIVSWVVSIFVFFIGLLLFSRVERTFMDTI